MKETFSRLKSAFICSKQREFQYKLLHGAVYTKQKLFQFGFESDNLCSFCKQQVETYQHLFLDCLKVKQLWKEVIKKLNLKEVDIDNWKTIFIGLSGKCVRIHAINCIIFLLKHIIFTSRKNGELPSVHKTTDMIKRYRNEEYNIANKIGKLGVHFRKWEQIDAFL